MCSWFDELLKVGWKKPLTQGDLWSLSYQDSYRGNMPQASTLVTTSINWGKLLSQMNFAIFLIKYFFEMICEGQEVCDSLRNTWRLFLWGESQCWDLWPPVFIHCSLRALSTNWFSLFYNRYVHFVQHKHNCKGGYIGISLIAFSYITFSHFFC